MIQKSTLNVAKNVMGVTTGANFALYINPKGKKLIKTAKCVSYAI